MPREYGAGEITFEKVGTVRKSFIEKRTSEHRQTPLSRVHAQNFNGRRGTSFLKRAYSLPEKLIPLYHIWSFCFYDSSVVLQ